MYSSSVLAKAVRFAMLGGVVATAATAAPAFAEEGAEKVERIEVTGSRIKRTDIEGANPVTVIDRAALLATGETNVGDLLQNQTFSAGIATNNAVNNGGSGEVNFSLRGLGSERTLVLLNGRRVVPSGALVSAAVDLQTIPTAMVERVEVLKDGASAIYGSDAIAGVVNIITRKDFEGVEVSAYAGDSQHGGGEKKKIDLTLGTTSDRGNATISIGYYDQKPVYMGQRSWADTDYFLFPTNDDGSEYEIEPGGSSAVPWVNVSGADGNPNQTLGPDYAGWRDFGSSGDYYNYNPVNYLYVPNRRYNAAFDANYELGTLSFGDFTVTEDVRVFAEAQYTNRRSERLLASEPLAPLVFFDHPAPYSADNYYNQQFGPKDANGDSYEIADWRRRMVETGGRKSNYETNTYRTVVGFNGLFSNGWGWEFSYNYGKNSYTQTESGYFNLERVAEAVGPTAWVDSAGNIVAEGTAGAELGCLDGNGAVIDGCVPLNIFGENSVSQDMLDYISTPYDSITVGEAQQSVWQFLLNGDIVDVPAGTIAFAGGVEYRREKGSETPDSLIQRGITTAGSSQPTDGAYTVKEAFVEFNIPVLSGLPGAQLLEFDIAGRAFDYSNFGSDSTYKLGFRWKPIDELMIRGTASQAFRAPSSSELFAGTYLNYPNATDPCESPEPNQVANCVSSGAPAGGYDSAGVTQIPTLQGGSDALQPETADILTAGVVWAPEYVEGLNLTVDWYNIKLEDTISTIGTDTILSQCANNGVYCDLINRRADGNVSYVTDLYTNVGQLDTSGMDAEIRYSWPDTPAGDWVFGVNWTHLLKYDKTLASGEVVDHVGKHIEDQDGHFARNRINFNVDWGYNDFSVTWQTRYISSVSEEVKDYVAYGFPSTPRTVDNNWVTDLQGSWAFHQNMSITIGINNLFDQDPPYAYSGFNGNTVTEAYDVMGRYFYTSLNAKF